MSRKKKNRRIDRRKNRKNTNYNQIKYALGYQHKVYNIDTHPTCSSVVDGAISPISMTTRTVVSPLRS